MNKRFVIICLIVTLLLTVVCCASCKTDKTEQAVKTIDKLVNYDYRTTQLKVTTTLDGVTLNAEYTLTKTGANTNVAYAIDRLNRFDVSGNSISSPSSVKTRIQGSAVYNGTEFVSMDGSYLDESILLDIVNFKIKFDLSYFNTIVLEDGTFTAKVGNILGFMQNENFDGYQMDVAVAYGKDLISSLTINYASSIGTKVKLEYSFAR